MEKLAALHPDGVLEAEDVAEELPFTTAADGFLMPWREARERYLSSFEVAYARALLARCDGNVSAAAREAGVDRKTFYALLKREKPPQVEE